MKLKYKLVISLFLASALLVVGGYLVQQIYIIIVGMVIAALGFSVMLFGDKDDKSLLSLLITSLLFGL